MPEKKTMNVIESDYDDVKNGAVGDKVYCQCVYKWKDNIKKLGFKWNPKYKLWYIEKDKFTKKIFMESQAVRFSSSTSIGTLEYYYVHYIKGQKGLNDQIDKLNQMNN